MMKHRGFPSRLPGTDYQFTIRRPNPKGVTPIIERERFRDRKPADKRADNGFVRALLEQFWDQPFERGNLDAGRLSWLFGREVGKAYVGLRWLISRTGPGASNQFESAAFIRSKAGVKYPDIQYHFLPLAVRYEGRVYV